MPRFKTGTDDFKKLRESGGYFVDKSLLIKEVLNGNDVTLLPRPRRFGKTLNMTMLRYFFEKSQENRCPLFHDLTITEDADAMAHQGRYPVIYLSLKDVKGNNWEQAFVKLRAKLSELFHQYAEVKTILDNGRERRFCEIAGEAADYAVMTMSLKELVENLHDYYKKPVVVLLDEYDTPVIDAWKNGYYEEMIDFMRTWLAGALKPERGEVLYRAVITGILRVARESMFSGLNNLDVANMLEPGPFADKFGFTQSEVDKVLESFQLAELAKPMQEWYNGYSFGGHTIYNPWSVISCVDKHPAPVGPRWLNTASNDLVYHELEAGGLPLKRDLEKLLAGEELRYPIQDSTTFSDLGKNPETVWSFLFFSGYLKASDPKEDIRGRMSYQLAIPNREVFSVYQSFVDRVFAPAAGGIDEFLNAFLGEDFGQLELLLQELVRNLVSCHDVGRYPEAAYHTFILGLLANLRNIYEIRSNPESGYGRADIIMQPKTADYPLAFVIEFKSIVADGDLAGAAAGALAQIEEKGYDAPLLETGIKPEMIRKLAIIVSGKRVKVQQG